VVRARADHDSPQSGEGMNHQRCLGSSLVLDRGSDAGKRLALVPSSNIGIGSGGTRRRQIPWFASVSFSDAGPM
jgi:hypothetical protein